MYETGDGAGPPGPHGPMPLPPGLHPFAAALDTVRQVGRQGRAALAEASPEQVVAFTVLCDQAARALSSLRGEAVLDLATQWTCQDPTAEDTAEDTAGDTAGDAAQAGRLRKVARSAARSISRTFAGNPDLTERAHLADDFAVAEVSLACVVSKYAAHTWLRHATALASRRLPVTREAYRAGRLEVGKVAEIVRLTEPLTDDHARQVEALVVPDAIPPVDPAAGDVVDVRYRTVRDVRNALLTAIAVIDPAGVADRAADAVAGRTVTRDQVDLVMGRLQVILPVADVALIWQVLDDAVEAAEAAGDTRLAGQVRADTLRDLILHGGITGLTEPETTDLLDTDTETTADADADADGQPVEEPVVVDPIVEPIVEPGPASTRPACRCGKTPRRGRVDILVIVGLETLLGLNNHPGILHGYGPIAADLARDLAAHGTWRCAAVDNEHGTLLGLGSSTYTPRYTPPLQLRRMVQATWTCCALPGCNLRSTQCDLDHTKPWPSGDTCD